MLDFKELFSIPTEVHFQRFSNSKDTYLIIEQVKIYNTVLSGKIFKFLNDLRFSLIFSLQSGAGQC